MLLTLLFSGCNSMEEPLNGNANNGTRAVNNSLEDYAWIGNLHNEFLDIVTDENASEGTRSLNPEIDWDLVNQEQVRQAQLIDEEPKYKTILVNELKAYKRYYDPEVLYDEAFPNGTTVTLRDNLVSLEQSGFVDRFEVELLLQLAAATNDNMRGVLSSEELTSKVMSLCDKWEAHYKDTVKGCGSFSAYILSISKSSMEWWAVEADTSTRAIQLIIGQDIAGAVVGAVSSAVIQYTVNKQIDGLSVGYSALAGAITGSTGIVGKAGKFISKFLKGMGNIIF